MPIGAITYWNIFVLAFGIFDAKSIGKTEITTITALLNQINTIANYLECPDITSDNNFQERLIKTVCTTRKDSSFASTKVGART